MFFPPVLTLFLLLLWIPNGWAAPVNEKINSLILTPQEQAWLEAHPIIRFGTDRNWIPYAKLRDNGSIAGIEADLLARICALTGANIQLELGVWSDMVIRAERGELDGLAVSAAHPERAAHFFFSDSPYTVSRYIYVHARHLSAVHSMADLAGKKVGMQRGNLAEQKVLARWPEVRPVLLDSNSALAVALLNGQIEAAISSISFFLSIREEVLPDLVIAFAVPDTEIPLRYSIRKEHPELLSIVNKALASISQDEIYALLVKWGAIYNSSILDKNIVSTLSLTEQEQTWLSQHTNLRYCFSPVWKPYDYFENGQHVGMFKDYLDLFAHKLGITLEPIPTLVPDDAPLGWKKALDFAKNRRCDFISGAVRTAERENYLNFSQPYFNITQVLIAKPDKTFVSNLEAIQDQTIAVLPNSAVQSLLQHDFPNLKLVTADTANMEKMLDENEVYAFVVPLENAVHWLNERLHNYKIIGKLDYAYPISIAIRNDWPLLLSIMNKMLASISSSEHNDILRKWTTHTLEEKIDYRQLLQIIVGSLLIIMIILYWNRQLAHSRHALQQAQTTAENHAERLRSVITAMAEGIVMQNCNGEIVECNAAAQRILGLSKEQMMGKTSLDPYWRVIREDGSPFPGKDHPLPLALRTGHSQYNVIQGIYRSDDQLVWILINAEPLFQSGNKLPYAGVATFTDITATRNAKLEIEEQRRTLQAVVENIPAGVQVFSPEVNLLLSNRQAEELLGQPTVPQAGKDLTQIYPVFIHGTETPYPPNKMPIIRALAGENSMVEDMELRRFDGSRILLQVIGAPIHNEQGKVVSSVVIFQNITIRKQTETELIRARQAAEAANQAKSAFLANMSHELRTPLNAILGFAQILLSDSQLTKVQYNQVQRILSGGEYLLTLINDILDLAKVEAGRFELLPEIWNTQGFFQDLEHIFKLRAEQKDIFFRHEVVGTLPQSLYADDKRLRQILINLLGNALKFTANGTVTLRTYFVEDKLCLDVSDTGMGITPTDLKKIFQPFQQFGEDRYKAQGTGLGLAITQRLVAAMGGELSVDSLWGQGSTFHVKIPVEVVSTFRETESQTDQPAVIGYQCCQGNEAFKILVVDDIADNRLVLRHLLEPLGFIVAEAHDGQHCLDIAKTWLPDLIFMDLRMPNLDGLEAIRQLRILPKFQTVPIVVLSASIFAEDCLQTQAAGSNAHLGKPIRLKELLDTLGKLLPLVWSYAAALDEKAIPEPLSQEQSRYFQELVNYGDITGLQELIEQWQHSGCCPIFVEKLNWLMQHFDLEGLKELAEFYAS